MAPQTHHYFHDVISGAARGPIPSALRLACSLIEPFYATTSIVRNRLYDRHLLQVTRLPRPVISIGNITTGGTGKTPMVRWLASRLRDMGKSVAILSRGYKSMPGQLGDEQ